MKRSLALVVFTALFAASFVQASPIGLSVESFEGLTAGPGIRKEGRNYFRLGGNGPVTLPSGVMLTRPAFDRGIFSEASLIDFSLGQYPTPGISQFGIGEYGNIDAASDVLFGSAFLARGGPGSVYAPIEFTFPTDMLRVGAYVTGTPGKITIKAFDANGVQIGAASTSAVPQARWGQNLLALEHPGIRKVQFNGDYLVLDGLRFEPAPAPVPEPASLILWGMGLSAAARLRRRFVARAAS